MITKNKPIGCEGDDTGGEILFVPYIPDYIKYGEKCPFKYNNKECKQVRKENNLKLIYKN